MTFISLVRPIQYIVYLDSFPYGYPEQPKLFAEQLNGV